MDDLQSLLREHGQQHVLAFWEQLSAAEQRELGDQVRQLDLPLVSSLVAKLPGRVCEETDWASIAAAAEPPAAVRDSQDPAGVRAAGEAALRAGRVGMILVAGGQGSRLGFDHPKGLFKIGPVSGRTLFQVLIDRLRAVGRRYGISIPLYLMTSPATHDETVEYFRRNDRCGLAETDLEIFCQGVMPAVDAQSGRLLRQTRSSLALSPDGHGGMLAAFDRSGCLQRARQRGIELLFYGQVDNPLLQVCDPALLGCHLASEAELTTQVVRKDEPEEKVGNVVRIDGRTRIIEYSDLPADVAAVRNPDGSLRLWAGSIAVHIFDLAFLARMAKESEHLPFHQALKKVEHVGDDGQVVQPDHPNAIKFERFIFDLLPAARRAAVVEAAKEAAFAPVKNADGAATDTPSTARQAMVNRDAELLISAGVQLAAGTTVEVNPLWALDVTEARERLDAAGERTKTIREPTYLAPTD